MQTQKYSSIVCADIGNSVGSEITLSSSKLALWLGVDFLFTQTVINFLSTASWRGVWNIIDIIFSGEGGIFEGKAYKDSGVTCCAGIILNIIIYASSKTVQRHLKKLPNSLFLITSRLFTTICFTFYMLLWRSFWNLLYLFLPTILSKLLAFLGSAFLLCLARCFNSNIGVPGSIELDNRPDYCVVYTLLSSLVEKKSLLMGYCLILADVFSTVTIEILVIFCWFGTYEIIVYTLPAQPSVSQLMECLIPIALGVLSGVVAFVAQMLILVWIEGKHSGWAQRRVAHFVIACIGEFQYARLHIYGYNNSGLLSTIFHWYGMWTLLDYYILPHHPVYSNLLTSAIGIIGLSVLGASRCLHGGVSRDAEPGEGYPIQPYYFIGRVSQ